MVYGSFIGFNWLSCLATCRSNAAIKSGLVSMTWFSNKAIFGYTGYNLWYDNATLYHCTSGKDRTGVATALILSALNVDRGVINANYLESNTYRQATIDADLAKAKKYTKDQKVLDILQDMESVKQPYLDAYFNELNAKYGSVNDYLHNQLGLTDQDIQTLQAKYLVNNN